MPSVTDEQIAAARSVDLLTYLQTHEPGSLRKSGGEYCLTDHDSLKISNGKWFWHSRGFGSNNALDFLVQVRGMGFTDAVKALADDSVTSVYTSASRQASTPIQEKRRKPFVLPTPYRDNYRVMAYLMGRGIDREIVEHCIKAGTLYEDKDRHDCIFVGKDDNGKARFACRRATSGGYKKDVPGSDKRYGFAIPSRYDPMGRSLFVFESPIDLLAQATLDKRSGIGEAWDCFHRVSLGGVSPLALMEYIWARPEIDRISLCLDNDDAGREATERIRGLLEKTPHPLYGKYKVNISPPASGKDYCDHLNNVLREQREQNKPVRGKDADISL